MTWLPEMLVPESVTEPAVRRDSRRGRGRGLRLFASGAAGAAVVATGRRRYLRWGATDVEVAAALPGDEFLATADLTATRAISVRAAPDAVWPWVAQLGQGRGGFYSYDFLENLVGCRIHSAERIEPQWQGVAVGDPVYLHPDIRLTVALVQPDRALVLRGGVPMGRTAPPYDFTWAFVLRAGPAGTTRLVVRERYAYLRPWAALVVEPAGLVSAVMSRKMLRGIRARAEQAGVPAAGVAPSRGLGRRMSRPLGADASVPSRPGSGPEPTAGPATPWAARRVRRDWAQLSAATPNPAVFDHAMVADLPEPARRYLTHAIAAGTTLWQSVQLSMVGTIKLGAWRPFTATQVLAQPHGYIWAADARLFGIPVIGYDRLSAGTAEMRWRLLDLVPVMTADGPDVARSAAGRLASEIALIPTAFAGASWTAGGPDTAVATWGAGADEQRVELHLGPSGRLLDLVIQRWGNPDGKPFGRYPFGVTVEEERTDVGVTTPAALRAGWWRGTDRQDDGEFFRAQITAVTFR